MLLRVATYLWYYCKYWLAILTWAYIRRALKNYARAYFWGNTLVYNKIMHQIYFVDFLYLPNLLSYKVNKH